VLQHNPNPGTKNKAWSLLELKRELAVAEYGVKMLNQRGKTITHNASSNRCYGVYMTPQMGIIRCTSDTDWHSNDM
jgi:hypothetical protein